MIQPTYLYKVLTIDDWKESHFLKSVKLSEADENFIHFSTENQLERIIEKYWAHLPHFIVLKIDPIKLVGKLVYEVNPGGLNKYYHLYEGSIPLNSIVELKVIKTQLAP